MLALCREDGRDAGPERIDLPTAAGEVDLATMVEAAEVELTRAGAPDGPDVMKTGARGGHACAIVR